MIQATISAPRASERWATPGGGANQKKRAPRLNSLGHFGVQGLGRDAKGACCEAEARPIQSPTPEQLRVKGAVKGALRMRNIYEVLRQKELDVSRLQKEVKALRVAAPLLLADGEAENDNQLTLRRAVNDTQQPDHSGWQARGKKPLP